MERIRADYVLNALCEAMTAKAVWLIPIVALGVALLEMPYGYYMLLRLLVCGVCIYLAVDDAHRGRTDWAWMLGGVAVLYNPVFRIPLSREIWSVVNVATILLFTGHMWATSRRSTERRGHSQAGKT